MVKCKINRVMSMRKLSVLLSILGMSASLYANPGLIQIVAAENFYGSVAQNIGAPYVQVTSVLNNPVADPHSFSAGADVAKAVDKANIVIENGAGYDVWMDRLYQASSKKAVLINVGNIMNVLPSQNPHIWYAPQTMPAFAQALTLRLSALDPAHASEYQKNLSYFLQRANLFNFRVTKVRRQVTGESMTATEPVFDNLATALGLKILNMPIQWKVMNGVPLSPQEIIAFETSLSAHQVKVLVYNNQVVDPVVEQFKAIAQQNNIPVIGVSELMPANTTYYHWMHQNLENVAHALGVKA
jgi:zinc/manganese transport system substrate-binding protein